MIQGFLTLASCQARAIMTDEALASLTTTGSILVLCLSINLIWDKKIRVANMLPVIAVGVVIALI